MNFFQKIVQLLRKPFPGEEGLSGNIKTIIYVSIFITLFLYIFQPFDLSRSDSNIFLISLGFGGMTFLACIIYEFVFLQWLGFRGPREKYTFGKWILNMIGTILCISVANFLFARLTFFGYIQWEFLPHMMISTFTLGIFPVVAIGAVSLLRQEKKYQHIAEEINLESTPSSIKNSGNDLSIFDVPISQIRYVEALQNYVKIGYVHAAQLKEKTERATLKSVIHAVEGTSIIRCHRSFLVHRDAVIAISGNAQGLLLTLSDCDKIIPVSRSYVSVFREN